MSVRGGEEIMGVFPKDAFSSRVDSNLRTLDNRGTSASDKGGETHSEGSVGGGKDGVCQGVLYHHLEIGYHG